MGLACSVGSQAETAWQQDLAEEAAHPVAAGKQRVGKELGKRTLQ